MFEIGGSDQLPTFIPSIFIKALINNFMKPTMILFSAPFLPITVTIIALSLIAIFFLSYKPLLRRFLFNHKNLVFVAKIFYNHYYAMKRNHLRVNNYGYAPIDEDISRYAPIAQCGMQLYNEAAKNQSGYLNIDNRIIVEVGCGRGGGGKFLLDKFNPEKYIGVDFSKRAIEQCSRDFNQMKSASFICGDAHDIPLDNNTADVVINIESSHIYKNQTGFFKEAHRILKANGTFILSDFRYIKNSSLEAIEESIRFCGFKISQKRIITQQVYQACIHLSELRKELINKLYPWYLKKVMGHYAALAGTRKSVMFNNGDIVYFIYHFEKL